MVWRSGDCGRTWRRLPDRPAFFLGRNAVGLDAIDTAATADTLLVLGRQGGEEIPVRHWAWTMDGAGDWRRIRRGLQRVIDFGLDSDGQRFSAVRLAQVPDAIAEGHLVTSDDGRHWEDRGVLPARSPVIPDVARGRLLIQTEVVGTGWVSPETQASIDGITWTPVVRAAPTTQSSASQLFQSDGVLVWVVDVVDRTDSNAWSWIGVSEDGGVTWTVSAGWPGMRLAGLTSVAASDGAVVLAFSGEQFDGIHLWALPRDQAAG